MESLPNETLENIFTFLPKTYIQRYNIISTCRRWNDFGYVLVDYDLKKKLIDYLINYAFLSRNTNRDIVQQIKFLLNDLENAVLSGIDLRIEIAEKLEQLLARHRFDVLKGEDGNNDFIEFSCTKVFPQLLSQLNNFYDKCCYFHFLPDTLTYHLPSQ